MRSWERVYAAVTPALKKKDKGIVHAFKLFLAPSLELHAGRIGRQDLVDRVGHIVRGNMNKREGKGGKGTPLSEAQERYGRLYLHDSIFSDEGLVQILCDGRIVPEAINGSLSVHSLFVEPDDEPNWRKVWHGFLRDAQEFEEAFKALEKEFAARAHDQPGIVFHVIGSRLWGAEMGQLSRTEAEIVAESKGYIDDLRRAGRLSRYRPDGFSDAAYGLQFHNAGTAAFRELMAYYTEQGELAYRDTWPEIAQSLLADVSGDCEKFYRRICWSQGTEKPDCVDDPILSRIASSSFVDKFVSCSPDAQRTVLEGLKARYESGSLAQSLAEERTWIIDVYDELHRRLPALSQIRRYSISHDANRLLGALVREARELVGVPS